MTVRKIQEQDVDFIASAKDFGFIDGYSKKIADESVKSDRFLGFLIEEDGKPIGYIICSLTEYDMDIDSIFTLPLYRGKGVATVLLKKCIEEAKNQNKTAIFLEVRKNNAVARSLYEKAGFDFVSFRKKYYFDGEDCAVYKKEL